MRVIIRGAILLSLISCAGKEQAAPTSAARGFGDPGAGFDQSGSETTVGSDSLRDPPDGPRMVSPSPQVAKEIVLGPGDEVADLTVSTRGPEVYAVALGRDGRSRVISWSIGERKLDTIATLPDSVRGRAIVQNPARGSLYVAGDTNGGSRIYRYTPEQDGWKKVTLYSTRRIIERLVISTRPFAGDDGVRYRLFFAARSADGSLSVRTITEGGRLEYQVIGPQKTVDSTEFEFPPERLVEEGAAPLQFHPNGASLFWRGAEGCVNRRDYSIDNWSGGGRIEGSPVPERPASPPMAEPTTSGPLGGPGWRCTAWICRSLPGPSPAPRPS